MEGTDAPLTEAGPAGPALRVDVDEIASLRAGPAPAPGAPASRRAAGRLGLRVVATLFDEVVEDRTYPWRQTVQIGHSGAMAVPVPRGWPYLARVVWTGPDTVRVTDGAGVTRDLGPDGVVRVDSAPIRLEISVVPRFLLRRTEPVLWWGSLTWLAAVLAMTLVTAQGELLWSKRCEWFGFCPPPPVGSDSSRGQEWTAEYLERLLRKDYAGEQQGVISKEIDRELGERKGNDIYMPAGSEGPATEMGGAADVAPQEVRAEPDEEPEPEPVPPKGDQVIEVVAPDVGTEIALPDGFEVAEADEVAPGEDEVTTPTEDHEGWGLQDWYDASDEAYEEVEIEVMLATARRRLAIDPNDPMSLEVLSYYQYLAQDYDGALETYDRYIGLYPDHSGGYNNKALIYKRRGDYTQEEALYRVALALAPDDETALNNLAVCLAHQGRFAEALAIMERLETIDPGDAYADLHRSKIYASMGDDEQALAYLEKALDGMQSLDTLHHIEFRQDIRLDPSFAELRKTTRFHAILVRYNGSDSPLQEGPE